MRNISAGIKRIVISSAVVVLSGFSLIPLSNSSVSADCDPTPPADSTYGNGTHHPVGADAGTFTYDCNTGTWSNQYYVYYPATNTRKATYPPNYAYNCATGTWTMDEYDYNAASGSYTKNRVTAPDPGLATGCTTSSNPSPTGSGASGSGNSNGSTGGSSNSISNTGPNSANGTSSNTSLNGSTNNNTNLGMNNAVYSNAATGNTFVIGNTTGGSATSGNAISIANIANLLQSTSGAFGNAATFTANINGDVNGDFMLDPSAVMNTGTNSNNSASNNVQVNTNNDNNTNAQINNNVNVGASSGNATVADNTSGGNATSGNADAIVNLMNLINSSVAAGQSFIGTVNINGNLNGDILLPEGLVNQLLASTGLGSSNLANANLIDNSTTTNNTNQAISNTITSSASTGTANVSNNTGAGNATSGSANTGVTLLNLTGQQTVGKNDLLVFVNVLGKWVGMIMNAPAGSTAAELGGGITSTGPNSANTTSSNAIDNSTTTNNTNQGINNNVNVHANSGNASVTGNTLGGNATTGNANTAVNILNIEGSNIDLSNWFGVLFINVFGSWTGSFGINTSAGDPINNPTYNPIQAANEQAFTNAAKQFASFVPKTASALGTSAGSTPSVTNTADSTLGAHSNVANKVSGATITPDNETHASYLLPAIGVSIAAFMLIGERIVTNRKSR